MLCAVCSVNRMMCCAQYELCSVQCTVRSGKGRGWREPGNKTLQRERLFLLVLFKKGVPDQKGRPAGHIKLGAGAVKRFLVLFRIIEQDKELVQNS